MTGYITEIMVFGETTWSRNGCVYKTREDAEASGRDLLSRWTMAKEFRVVEVEQEPNQEGPVIYGPNHRVRL